ncbi:MAG TPA: ergothioneine biosynthesis protein EgtC [Acidimicrobiales bacterium]
MCRLVGYVGPPVTLEELLLEPEHSLLRQSWAPERQRHGTVNADGFGAGWYDLSSRPEPARYRRAGPMWADRSFASLAGLVRSSAVLAGVRSATPPAPAEESGTPPFTWGPWLFAHNGAVDGFREGPGATLRRALSDRRLVGVEGAADSEVLFALTLDRLDAGAAPEDALASVVKQVTAVTTGRLTMMLTDGRRLAAAVCGEALYRIGSDHWTEGLVVASEPSDARPGWRQLNEGTLLSAHDGGARVRESSL